ncbi:MAG: hypothetical protein JJU28_11725 [Cyclobacteriaceae bacterium]|nr:hypothetical protein [Cyclobacteriaceae bacterium]
MLKEDDSILTIAKVELAENHGWDYHQILYKSGQLAVDHLILHELVHIKFAEEARKEGVNKIFTEKKGGLRLFKDRIKKNTDKLIKKGIPAEKVMRYVESIFDGINLLVYNAPIDLFIEDFLYHTFPKLRPYQFYSLYRLNAEAVQAVTDPASTDLAPPFVLSVNKVYNAISTILFEDLYGIKSTGMIPLTGKERNTVKELWDEYTDYRNDKEPGEEYEVAQNWGDDLEMSDFFEFRDELVQEKKLTFVDNDSDLLNKIERWAEGVEESSEEEREKMETFLAAQKGSGLNMSVVMYMVGALQYFQAKPREKIKEVAFEIAMLGRTGISPEKKNYKLNHIPSSTFSGYRLLAYYYVSWAVAIPEMLKELQLPFEQEYDMAKKLFKD